MSTLAQSTTRHRIRVSDDARYLTIGQVRERFGVSDMWVWRYTRDHGFPRPVQIGGPTSARHWLLTDIEQWQRERASVTCGVQSKRQGRTDHGNR
jgi:predicted DNA-binding transcriptional regulator AlpA